MRLPGSGAGCSALERCPELRGAAQWLTSDVEGELEAAEGIAPERQPLELNVAWEGRKRKRGQCERRDRGLCCAVVGQRRGKAELALTLSRRNEQRC